MAGVKSVRAQLLGAVLLTCVASALTASAAAAAEGPANTSPPSISGLARDGQRLTVDKGAWSGSKPIAYSYRWARCNASGETCTNIATADKLHYKLAHEDVGHTLRATVTAVDATGETSAISQQSEVVAAAALAKARPPKIAGALKDGQLLTVSNGTWKGSPPQTFSYQWRSCYKTICSNIPGAIGSSFRVTSAQIGDNLRAVVTATNAVGEASATSGATRRITAGPPVNLGAPAVAGSLQEGQVLRASTGQWAGTAPISFAYQWLRCSITGGGCQEIAGATGSEYTATGADLASNLAVVVTASNAQGSASATSLETQPILGILPSNTIAPTISGLLQEGQLLKVVTGVWSGTEPIAYEYQWQLCNALGKACEEIKGATGSSLPLGVGDIGKTLAVVVTATNSAGSTSVTTAATELVAGILPKNTSLPSISGLLQDGQLLSVVTGSWSGTEPIEYAYQWELCNALGKACEEIKGATGTSLPLGAGDIGKTLAVVVTATNVTGSSSATSSVTGLIEGILPKNTSLPSISGVLQEGQLLSVTPGSWSGSEPLEYEYQWQLCNALGKACEEIKGAKGTSLPLGVGDIGKTLDVVVTATNSAGSTSVTTAATELVAGILPKNSTLPSISGMLQEGQLLNVTPGSWSGSEPISYEYQWQLCNALGKACEEIKGATGTSLKLAVGDIGKTLEVVVTAKNVAGSSAVTSSVTGLIEGILPKNTSLPTIGGLLKSGQLLSASPGSWTGSEPIEYTYQWQLCGVLGNSCANIAKATSSSFLLGLLDVGNTLRVIVTASNVAGSTAADSAVSGLIAGL
jgi:hypothetical protein